MKGITVAKKTDTPEVVSEHPLLYLVSDLSPASINIFKRAKAALAKDKNAPSVISIDITPYVHAHYPKMLYKGAEAKPVANEEEHAAAEKQGFGTEYKPE
jgi:hypothetical protein